MNIIKEYPVTKFHNKEMIPIAYLLNSILLCAIYTDLTEHKIRNELIYVGTCLKILHILFCQENILQALLKFMVIFLILFPLYLIKGLGAGDIKLFMMTGLYLNGNAIYHCIFYSLIIGAVVGICKRILITILKSNLTSLSVHQIHFSIPIFISVLGYQYGFYLSTNSFLN